MISCFDVRFHGLYPMCGIKGNKVEQAFLGRFRNSRIALSAKEMCACGRVPVAGPKVISALHAGQ